MNQCAGKGHSQTARSERQFTVFVFLQGFQCCLSLSQAMCGISPMKDEVLFCSAVGVQEGTLIKIKYIQK